MQVSELFKCSHNRFTQWIRENFELLPAGLRVLLIVDGQVLLGSIQGQPYILSTIALANTESFLEKTYLLRAAGCLHVAIESTGVYWKPVFNILEVRLVNARDAKGDKARKREVIDAEWLADLLRHGLLKPSFILPRQIRELRELTPYRESLVREQTALANRIQQLIERAQIRSVFNCVSGS